MTKGELKKALAENLLPDDSEVFVATEKRLDGEAVWWNEIDYVDETDNGAPIIIGAGELVMEQGGHKV